MLIDAIVDCVRPQPGEIVADPACGTGGFLLSAHEYLKNHSELDRDQKRHLRFEALRGVELVPNVARLCGMNLFLHSIGPDGTDDHDPPITIDDALRDEPSARERRHHQSPLRQEVSAGCTTRPDSLLAFPQAIDRALRSGCGKLMSTHQTPSSDGLHHLLGCISTGSIIFLIYRTARLNVARLMVLQKCASRRIPYHQSWNPPACWIIAATMTVREVGLGHPVNSPIDRENHVWLSVRS